MKYYALIFIGLLFGNTASAQFLFQEVTGHAGIYMRAVSTSDAGPGVVIFDYNGDGWDDIYMAGGLDSDKLYVNMHDGTFKNIAPPNMTGHMNTGGKMGYNYPRGGIAFDYDNDGFTDIYSVCENSDILWHNNGDGTFTNVMKTARLDSSLDQNESMSATFGDFNGDGYNDFYVARWIEDYSQRLDTYLYTLPKGFPNWFYVNNHDGTFTESAKAYGVDDDTATSNIALFFDYDRDGDLDLFVGNDNGVLGRPNRVYKNMLMETGVATFRDVTDSIGLDDHLLCMGIGALDFNRDGHFDFYETSFGIDSLEKNNGDNTFTNVSKKYLPPGNGYESGGSKYVTTSWSVVPGDFDNDGWEDVFVVHGQLGSSFSFTQSWTTNPNNLDTSIFLHNIGGYFENRTSDAIGGYCIDRKARGAASFDFNHDGKLDLCVGSLSRDPANVFTDFLLLKNITPDNPGHDHWLEMRFTAKRTAKEGIGTIVDVWAGGIVHSRQVSTGGGFGSQNSLVQHVGLGDYAVADSIVVYWPADKFRHRQIDRYYNVKADTILSYSENMDNASVNTAPPKDEIAIYPNPASKALTVEYLQPSIPKHFEIYDLLGVKHIDVTGSENTFSLSVGLLKSGCYVLRITTNGSTVTKQFIKQ